MATQLRIELIVLAVVISFSSIFSVTRKKMNTQRSLIWFIIAIGILVSAVYPGFVEWACIVTQIKTPSNMIFLVGICTVLFLSFHHEILISTHTNQIRRLIQMVSIYEYENKKSREEEDESIYDRSYQEEK